MRRRGADGARQWASASVGFAWLRLIGVSLVVVDHSVALTHAEPATLLPQDWVMSPGYTALMCLFAMSGYQVSGSWERDPVWWRFIARRVLRIVPPLVVVLMISVLVIGPLFTIWPASAYWHSSQTWEYLLFGAAVFPLQHVLPGVFVDNPYPWSVNGSLWTLPMELLGYLLVLIVGLLAAIRLGRVLLLPLLAGLLVMNDVFDAKTNYPAEAGSFGVILIGPLVSFLIPFVIGMILHTYRDLIPLLRLPALGLFVAWIALNHSPAGPSLLPVAAGYGAIVLAHHWPAVLQRARRWVRCSYGVYLWGFVVAQMIVAAGVRDQWVLMALAVPASYLCGLLSWRLIEEPTQELRVYLRKRPQRRTADRETLSGLQPQDQMA